MWPAQRSQITGYGRVTISETKIFEKRFFAPIFEDVQIYTSLSRPGMAVLFRKVLGPEMRPILLDSEGKLVVLNVDSSEGGILRLTAVYAFGNVHENVSLISVNR